MPGAGASSITFWWRRCSEQSRSNRCTTLPCLSPKTCTSIWRGFSTYFSTSTRSSPKAAFASRRAEASASREILRPLDPPHALAAAARARLDQHRIADLARLAGKRSAAPAPRRDSPARPARPAFSISRLAASFSPMARIEAAERTDEDEPGRRPPPRRNPGSPTGSRSPDGSPARPLACAAAMIAVAAR